MNDIVNTFSGQEGFQPENTRDVHFYENNYKDIQRLKRKLHYNSLYSSLRKTESLLTRFYTSNRPQLILFPRHLLQSRAFL